MDKRITIYDLAKTLGVSAGTVSRSLNDHPSISQKTKDRVIFMANELGYKTNKFAVNLSKQKSNTIGVIVPKLNSIFMSTVLAGIEKVANEAGYNLIISQSLESMEKEKLNAKTLYDSGVDALLVSLAYDTTDFVHFANYIKNKIPLIFIDRVHNLPNCSTIIIDNKSAGFEATEHLIAQGCKNLLHISGNLKRNVYSERLKGFQEALAKHNLKFKDANLLESDLAPSSVKEVIAHIKSVDIPIDGLFVANDTFAAHCIKELKKEKYNIPSDIKIIGFNNDPISELVTPALSTINYPGYELGVLAGQSVISHLNGGIDLHPANSITLRHKLIIRESTL
ncbi:LacI family DNA-binding transcriptional regulator [Arenibacter sp. M-2]|uniref:LacI family DNA-binding transcriptional regulator n=1 Tax=unclassified Arenibacter TaxID=2615047 RepID=UPI000D76160E|nr:MULTISPECIES: LacI family DNA-binding transcriptional regulator [unclassified Arenibacter]MDL5512555.1 LacI family DNA-binding transcriptional regulator [Arenibacter sp. M-2]PXX26010.1 LacI family transcriptional regulator [Arenibacter sp. ARW7G5Y1]|tara:strand:+ start:22726 stop:23739 length:1014 start_codon:yes stop_codon:yes gene_type:complete